MFVTVINSPYLFRADGRERTVFHTDGSRTVVTPQGSVRYAPDGTATFVHTPGAQRRDTVRYDLDVAA